MRTIFLPAALVFSLATATTAFAGGASPAMALFSVGPHSAAVTVDSPAVHTGRNSFTLELCSLPPESKAVLKLTGPSGQVVNVDLQPLSLLEGGAVTAMPVGADGHAGHNHSGGIGSMGSMSKDAPAVAEAAPHSHDGGLTTDAGFSYHVRGSAVLDETGRWVGTVVVPDPEQGQFRNDFIIDVVQGGPNPWFLSSAGVFIGGSLLIGATTRKRLPGSKNRA